MALHVSLMNTKTENWSWNDGWILMAIYLAQSNEKPMLANVIGVADAINHAIPSSKELGFAFTKLVNAGILKINGNEYRITETYIEEIENAYKAKGGLFETANKGLKWLKSSGILPTELPKVRVTEEELKSAYKEYISQIWKKG